MMCSKPNSLHFFGLPEIKAERQISHMLSRTIILVLVLLSNLMLSVLADGQPTTALDWRLHLNVDKFTDEKTLIASTEYPLGGHTIKITFSCVQKPELGLPSGPGLDPLALVRWPMPVYMEVNRYNDAADNSCKDIGFLKSETLKYDVSGSLEYRIDDGDIFHVTDASGYCNTAKLVFGAGLDASALNVRDLVNMEYSEIRAARRLRIRIKDQTDANFDVDINMTTPVIRQFVAQCPVLSVNGVGQ
jgi:hypothetical protein